MSFTNVPAELVVRIFHYVLPEDLEAFAPTCRHAYHQRGPRLEEHKQLKIRYSTQYFKTSASVVMTKMTQLCSEPSNASYQQHVSFTGHGPWQRDPPFYLKPGIQASSTTPIQELKPEIHDLLKTITQNISTMKLEQIMRWMYESHGTSNDLFLALCLCPYPNMKSIEYTPLHRESTSLKWSKRMVRQIVKSYSRRRPSRALSVLSSATIRGNVNIPKSLELFTLFLMLPAIE